MSRIAQYLQAPFEFTDNTLPVFNPNDPFVDSSSLFLYDGGYLQSWPSQAAPANGATITNLVPEGANAEVLKTANNIGFREGGFDFLGVAGNAIYTGPANAFRLADIDNPDCSGFAWIKRESGFSTGDYQAILGRNSANATAANNEWKIGTGPGGVGILISVTSVIGGTPTGVTLLIPDSVLAPLLNTTILIAFAVENGKLKAYLNGVFYSEVAFTKPFHNTSGQRIISGNGNGGQPFKGILKRWGFTKLSGVTFAKKMAEEWENNRVRLNKV
jgi:hypothetical protein